MDTKLTLKLDKAHIEKAKNMPNKRKQACRHWFEQYFAFLTDTETINDTNISPTVKKLTGILELEADFDLKREKQNRLMEKHNEIQHFY